MTAKMFSNGLMTIQEYVQARTMGLIGRNYEIEVDSGDHIMVKDTMNKKERIALWREALSKANNWANSFIWVEINVLKHKAIVKHPVNMRGEVNGIPYIDQFYDTPFANLKIMERLW